MARYVDELRAIDLDVDVKNQLTEAAYVGAELAVHALRHAAGMPGGITRENVATVLDSTSGWDVGLTMAPLSWPRGDHHAATTLHGFDANRSTSPTWQGCSCREGGDPPPGPAHPS